MKNVCIIPARAGSKRIKNKNTKQLAGKPLISWTIECALNSSVFDDIILSTDSEEVASIGSAYGLTDYGLRPHHLADDHSTAADVIGYYLNNEGNDRICYLQPTSPLRNTDDVISSLELMERGGAYSVVSVCEYNIPQNWIYCSDQNFDEFIGSISSTRSQDYSGAFVLNGAIYWFTTEKFNEYQTHLVPERAVPYIMPKNRSVDIDTIDDFRLAEFYKRNGC